jgi:hypothetical protein
MCPIEEVTVTAEAIRASGSTPRCFVSMRARSAGQACAISEASRLQPVDSKDGETLERSIKHAWKTIPATLTERDGKTSTPPVFGRSDCQSGN